MRPRSQPDTIGRDRALRQHRERAATLYYSLIESTNLAGVEPRAYLRETTLRAVRNPGTVTLPRDLKQQYTRSPRLF